MFLPRKENVTDLQSMFLPGKENLTDLQSRSTMIWTFLSNLSILGNKLLFLPHTLRSTFFCFHIDCRY